MKEHYSPVFIVRYLDFYLVPTHDLNATSFVFPIFHDNFPVALMFIEACLKIVVS